MATFNAQKLGLLMDLLSLSSSSEDEMGVLTERVKKPKIHNFLEIVHEFSEEEFRQNFRVCRETAYTIIQQYEVSTFYPSDATHGGSLPLSAEHDVLSFLCNKVSLRDVAQRFGVGTTTTFNQVKRIMNFLLHIAPSIIKFPNDKEIVSREFFDIAEFPDTIGCIDGTSITIRTPAHKIKSTCVNRHDIPSVTLQAICDAKKRFIDTSVGAPSKIHDARVYQLSDISSQLPAICNEKYHVLGDSAYPIREWLMVPFRDYGNLTHDLKLFNKKLCSTRVLIENSFGLLQGRFRQILEVHMHEVDNICKFIISCCVLHNLCIESNDEFDFECVIEDVDDVGLDDNESDQWLKQLGGEKRNAIMERLNNEE